jgi:archaellum component FlaC
MENSINQFKTIVENITDRIDQVEERGSRIEDEVKEILHLDLEL